MGAHEIEVRIPSRKAVAAWTILFLLLLAGAALATMVRSVGVSEVAVIVDPLAGRIVGTVVGPRLFLKAPWQEVAVIRTSIQSLDMWTDWATKETGEWPAVTALTRDGLEVHVDITVRWHVDPRGVVRLYENYPGLDWETKTLAPLLREVIRNTVANYTAVETIEKRAEISRIIVERYKEAVAGEESLAGAIVIDNIDLRNIDLPEKFKEAVEQKLAEQQMKMAATYKKERLLIEANATAMQRILEAEGAARAKVILANSTAQALRIVSQALGGDRGAVEEYLRLTLAKDIAASGGKIYIILVGGKGNATAQVIPVPLPAGG